MPFVNLPVTFMPTQVDVVPSRREKDPKPLKRSCEGALHLRAGVLYLTADEIEYLKTNRKDIHAELRVVALSEEERAPMEVPAAPAAPVIPEPSPSDPPTRTSRKSRGDGES